MKNCLLSVLVAFLSVAAWAESRVFSLDRPDGSRITGYLDCPDSPGEYPLVVVCQGSEAISVVPKYLEWVKYLGTEGVATLRVEKPGLDATSEGASEEYLRLNTPSRRTLDVLECLAHLERTEPAWNGQLALLGGSEGAEVAAQVAALQSPRRLKGLVLVVAGTTRTFREELLRSLPDEAPPEFLKLMEEARQDPTWTRELGSDGKTARNTFKWWAEMLEVDVCRNLDKLQCPLYILHGDKDPFTPPEVEALLRKRLAGKNLTYLRVTDCTHDIAAFPQGKAALLESFRWMVRCFRSKGTSGEKAQQRSLVGQHR